MNWDKTGPEPSWAKDVTDMEVVEEFWTRANSNQPHHEFGRLVRSLRKRLYRILIQGIEKEEQPR